MSHITPEVCPLMKSNSHRIVGVQIFRQPIARAILTALFRFEPSEQAVLDDERTSMIAVDTAWIRSLVNAMMDGVFSTNSREPSEPTSSVWIQNCYSKLIACMVKTMTDGNRPTGATSRIPSRLAYPSNSAAMQWTGYSAGRSGVRRAMPRTSGIHGSLDGTSSS